MSKRMMIAGLLVAAVIGSVALPGPVDMKLIGKDVKWAAHLDMEKARETVTGEFLGKHLVGTPAMSKIERGLRKIAGPDGTDKLRGITVYGFNTDLKKAFVLLVGEFDSEKIMGVLKEEELEPIDYQGYTVYSKDDAALTVVRPGLLAMGRDMAILKRGVDIIRGDVPNAAENDQLAVMKNWGPDTFAAIEISKETMQAADSGAEKAKSLKWAGVSAGESNGQLSVDMLLSITDAEKASQIRQMMQGLAAMVLLNSQEMPELASIIQNVKVAGEESLVRASLNYSAEKLFETMQKFVEVNQKGDGEHGSFKFDFKMSSDKGKTSKTE